MDQGLMGPFRQQPPREVLRTHQTRTRPTGNTDRHVAEAQCGDRSSGRWGVAMLTDLKLRLRSLLRRSAVDDELDDELRFHFEQQVAYHLARGISQEEALRLARLEFGGFEQTKDEHRDARG